MLSIKQILFTFFMIFLLTSCMLFQKKEPPVPPKEISQWAQDATASSAYGGLLGENRDDASPYAATGEPDVKKCEDNPKAWVSNKADEGVQWLELGYDKILYVSKISIYESYNPGGIIKVEGLDYDTGEYKKIWEDKYRTKLCPFTLEFLYQDKEGNITIDMTPFRTDKLKIYVDTNFKGWNEIDAVKMSGYEKRWYSFNNTLWVDGEVQK